MKRFLLLTIAVLAAAPALAAPGPRWQSWDSGLREAKQSGRPVLVDVYTEWCGWCKRMDRDVYSDPQVRDYLGKRYVTVKLDAEAREAASYEGKQLTSRTLASRFRVNSYPTTIFLRPDGQHLVKVPGYVPADRFLTLLRYIGDGHYERGVSFEEFSKRPAP